MTYKHIYKPKPLPRLESPQSLWAETNKAPDTERAWAAGFYSGEGCTSLHLNRSGNGYIRMSVANTRLDNIERLQSIIGGNISMPKKQNERWQQQWILYISTKRGAFIAFWIMAPWLSVEKLEQFGRVHDKAREIRREKILAGSKPSTTLWPTIQI